MRKTVLVLMTSSSLLAHSQSVTPEVVASAGAHFAIPSIQMSWTLGETVTQTLANGSATLTQGFHQSNISLVGVENLDPTVEINVYPNPISDIVNIELSANVLNSQMQLIDGAGRTVLTELVTELKFKIDFTSYSKGTYYLNFKNDKGTILQTITLQKIN